MLDRAPRFVIRPLGGLALCGAVAIGMSPSSEAQNGIAQSQNRMSAKIVGRVVSADNMRPLTRGRVTITGVRFGGSVTTDDRGAYEIAVEPGRYWIQAEREGYLSSYYGQSSSEDAPRSVHLESGEIRKEVDIVLGRASVVVGRVLDDLGEPVEGALAIVAAADLHAALTNDVGEFRVPKLQPGEYVVWALPPHPAVRIDQTILMPTYAPGTGDARAAVPIRVPKSGTATIDISLLRGKPVEVEGRVFNRSGNPAESAEVILAREWSGRFGSNRFDVANTYTGAGGLFVLKGVPPGTYRLKVTSGRERGETEVMVADGGLGGVTIATTSGATISGQVSIVSGGDQVCRAPVVTAGRVDSQAWDERTGSRARSDDRGRFQLGPLYGQQRLSVACPQKAIITQLMVNGKRVEGDILDTETLGGPIEVEIVAALRGGTAYGLVKDSDGRPCECTVLAVRADPALWLPPHDFLWIASAADGKFEFTALPRGEYVALIEPLGKRRWDSEYLRVALARGKEFRSDGQTGVAVDLTCR